MPRRPSWSTFVRWTIRAAAVVWLLLVGGLWVRSLYVTDFVGVDHWVKGEGGLVRDGFDVHLGRGEVGLSRGHGVYPPDWTIDPAPTLESWRPYRQVGDRPTRPPFHTRPETWYDAIGFGYGNDDKVFWGWRQRTVGVIVPFWLLMLPPAIVALRWAGRARRSHRRQRLVAAGRCGNCGYDLRATPGRCPECGTEAPVAQASSL